MKKPISGQTPLYISWNKIKHDVMLLASRLPRDAKLIGIPRGGIVVASLLPYAGQGVVSKGSDSFTVLVDDIVDSGHTMKQMKDLHPSFLTAALYYKAASILKPTYYIETIKPETWLVFPWE